MDKQLVSAVVVILAALAPSAGFSVAPEEQQVLVEAGGQVVAGVAALFATFRVISLRRSSAPKE